MSIPTLSGKFHSILYDNDAEWSVYYPDKFRARRAVVLHAISQGWTFDDCYREFLRFDNPGSILWTRDSKDKPLPSGKQLKRLLEDYKAEEKFYQANPPVCNSNEIRQVIGEAIAAARDYPWIGAAGRTDHDVLSYITKRMTKQGSMRMNIAVRDIAVGAGIGRETARISVRRLVKAGLILSRSPSRPGEATEITLVECQKWSYAHPDQSSLSQQEAECQKQSYSSLSCRDYMTTSDTDPSSETWVRLGKSCKSLYAYLTDEPRSADELSKFSGVSRKTVFRRLPDLVSNGLAEKTDDGYILGNLTPDNLIYAMGWIEDNSKTQRRKQQFDDERMMHKAKLDVYERLTRKDYTTSKAHQL